MSSACTAPDARGIHGSGHEEDLAGRIDLPRNRRDDRRGDLRPRRTGGGHRRSVVPAGVPHRRGRRRRQLLLLHPVLERQPVVGRHRDAAQGRVRPRRDRRVVLAVHVRLDGGGREPAGAHLRHLSAASVRAAGLPRPRARARDRRDRRRDDREPRRQSFRRGFGDHHRGAEDPRHRGARRRRAHRRRRVRRPLLERGLGRVIRPVGPAGRVDAVRARLQGVHHDHEPGR